MSSESKIGLSEAELQNESSEYAKRLAKAKQLKSRPNPEGLKNRLARSQEKTKRKNEAEQRRREREIRAVEVNAERLKTALTRAEEREKAAKEAKEESYDSYEVSAEEPKNEDYESFEISGVTKNSEQGQVAAGEINNEPSKETRADLDFIRNMKTQGVAEEPESAGMDMLKPAKFKDLKVGQSVAVKRSNGVIDNGWAVVYKSDEDQKVTVVKKDLRKTTSPDLIFIGGETASPASEKNNKKEEESKEPPLVKAARKSAAKDVPFITPLSIEESKRLDEEEEAEFKKANEKFAPKNEKASLAAEAKNPTLEKARARVAAMPEAARKRAEAGPLVKKLSGMSAKQGAEQISREVALGKQKMLDEIVARYTKKFGSKDNAHKFLMGPEAKGWFKGGQRKDQENYKKIFKELHG